MARNLFVISSASGAGKSTLIQRACKAFPQLHFSISATTRDPRRGEKESVHYFFKTREGFQAMIQADALAEYEEVHGQFYGTPLAPIETAWAAGKVVIMDIDVKGKINLTKRFPDAFGIFIKTPTLADLENRLRKRGKDSDSEIKLRLKNAHAEIEMAETEGNFNRVLINDNLDQTTEELFECIRAELEPQ